MLRWRLLTCSMFVLPLALAWQPRHLASGSRTPHFAPAIAAIADRNRDELLDSDEPLDSGERAALTREMLLIGAPALVGLAMDPVASLVDTAMIGRFCSAADLAGVGVAISVFNLIARTFNFLNSATTSAVAAASMDAAPGTFTAEMSRQAAAALAVAIVIGTVIACALVAAGGHLLRGLGLAASGPSAATLVSARSYLVGRALAAPAVLALMALQGAFRGARDTVTPLGALTLATALNLVLDPVLIVGLRLGVFGAALATTLSQYAAAALLWRRLAERCGEALEDETFALEAGGASLTRSFLGLSRPTRRVWGLPRPALADCLRAFKAGSLLTVRTLSVSVLLSYGSVGAATLGAAAGAAHQILLQICLASSLLADAVAIAGQSLLASALASVKGGRRRARAILRTMTVSGLMLGVATASALVLTGPSLANAFSTDLAVRSAAASTWPLMAWSQPLYTLAFTVDGMLFGASDWAGAVGIMLGSALPALALMRVGLQAQGLRAIWAALAVFMGLRALLGGARIASGRGCWKVLR